MSDNWIDKKTVVKQSKSDLFLLKIKNNRDAVIGGAVILIAAVILGTYFIMRYSQLNETAWQEFFKAKQEVYMGKIQAADKTINNIEKGFSKTSAAPYAILLKGDSLYRMGKYKEAIAEYTKAEEISKPEIIAPTANYNLGKTKEAAKDFEGAKKEYEKFLKNYPENFLAPEIHLSLARIYEFQNKIQKAKSAYEKIAVLYPQTVWAQAAKNKLMSKKAVTVKSK